MASLKSIYTTKGVATKLHLRVKQSKTNKLWKQSIVQLKGIEPLFPREFPLGVLTDRRKLYKRKCSNLLDSNQRPSRHQFTQLIVMALYRDALPTELKKEKKQKGKPKPAWGGAIPLLLGITRAE